MMNRYILLLLTFLSINSFGQNWTYNGLKNDYPAYGNMRNVNYANYKFGLSSVKAPNQEYYLFKTTNGGKDWIKKYKFFLREIAFKNADTSIAFASMIIGNDSFIYRNYITYDGWETISDSIYFNDDERSLQSYKIFYHDNSFYISFYKPRNGFPDTSATYISHNYGKSWKKLMDTGVTEMKFINKTKGYARFYIKENDYIIYKTTDGGKTWKKAGLDIFSKYMFPKYFFTVTNNFYRSSDEGKNWVLINQGLPEGYMISIECYCFLNDYIGFTYSKEFGFYKTTNSGGSWEKMWDGETNSHMNKMQCFKENDKYYIVMANDNRGTNDIYYGVYDSTELFSGIKSTPDLSHKYKVFPNPANERLSISYSGFVAASTMVRLYDISGKLILEKPLAMAETSLNISQLDKGIYVLKIEEENGVLVERIVKE
jgi:photosystem II stability/assembly factor-like uncharacterized protein